MTPAELDRLAHHATLERPDWPLRSVRTYLATAQASRPYLDVLLEILFVASDPATIAPKRIEESGPWKTILRPVEPAKSLPSSVPWACCAKCGLGHHADAPCERKAAPEVARAALAAMRKVVATPPERYAPPMESEVA